MTIEINFTPILNYTILNNLFANINVPITSPNLIGRVCGFKKVNYDFDINIR